MTFCWSPVHGVDADELSESFQYLPRHFFYTHWMWRRRQSRLGKLMTEGLSSRKKHTEKKKIRMVAATERERGSDEVAFICCPRMAWEVFMSVVSWGTYIHVGTYIKGKHDDGVVNGVSVPSEPLARWLMRAGELRARVSWSLFASSCCIIWMNCFGNLLLKLVHRRIHVLG